MSTLTTSALLVLVLAVPFLVSAGDLEEPVYSTLKRDGSFELRRYEPHLVASTTVDGSYDEASTRAFRRLASFIFGENLASDGQAEKIAMTAPVNMTRSDSDWKMTFMMPSRFSLESLPRPKDPRVAIEEWQGGLFAAVRFSGTWAPDRFEAKRAELLAWLERGGWQAVGPPVGSRFDPPWKPWFMRRNEILVPVEPIADTDRREPGTDSLSSEHARDQAVHPQALQELTRNDDLKLVSAQLAHLFCGGFGSVRAAMP